MKYTLYCFDSSVKAFREYKSFESLKEVKEYVEEERNEHYLACEMYVTNNTRIVKRYSTVELPKL